jgi:segregation and condensation protein B
LLGTTSEFLDYFSLKSIDDLPPLAELKSLSDLNLQLPLPVNGEGQPVEGSAPEGVPAAEAGAVVDSGEVPVVNAEDSAVDEGVASRRAADTSLDASADDDEDEELSAPGHSAGGLVAAPPSDES